MPDLFPSVTVTVAQRDKFYLAYAELSGYYEMAPDGQTRITDKSQWVNAGAVALHVKEQLTQMAKDAYRVSEFSAAQKAIPQPDPLIP